MYAKVSLLCLFLAVGLLVWGSLCMVWSGDGRQDEVALIVEDPEKDLGEQTLGAHTLELRVCNTSSQTRWVIGMANQ